MLWLIQEMMRMVISPRLQFHLMARFPLRKYQAILEHDTVLGNYNSLVQVDCDTYALAYAGDGADGFISTFTISSCEIEKEKQRSGACGLTETVHHLELQIMEHQRRLMDFP